MTFKACLEQMLLPFAFPLPFLSIGDLWFSQFLERLLITSGYLRNLLTPDFEPCIKFLCVEPDFCP